MVELREERGDLEAGVRTGLARLGYRVITPRESAKNPPDVRVLGARRLARLPQDSTPIVLLGVAPDSDDPRIVDCVSRPADLVGLYRALQRALEEHPREFPRVPTTLSARCAQGDQIWPGAILSISENGCLLRSPRAPSSDGAKLTFALPERGLIETTAEARDRRGTDTGLFFPDIRERDRTAIADYVAEVLMD